jgi:hypothetical protein
MFHSLIGRIHEDENKAGVIMARWGQAAGIAVVLMLLAVLAIMVLRGG